MSAAASLPLHGRVAMVTGSGRNLGRAVALRFAEAGADVVIHVRTQREEGEAVVSAVRELGRRAHLVSGDVSDPTDVQAMFQEAHNTFGRLDVFVNNVGVRPHGLVLELSPETWRWVIDVSLNGAFYCAQAAARLMVAGGSGGSIVNVTGSAAVVTKPGRGHVSAAKAGLQALTRTLAMELGPHGIRVNSVAPVNLRDTSRPPEWYPQLKTATARQPTAVPLGRSGTTADIAEVMLFLASDASAYITGQALHVNGGAYML